MADVVDRENYYTMSEIHQLTGVKNEVLAKLIRDGDLIPDHVVLVRTYFLKERFEEIFRTLQLHGLKPKDKRNQTKAVVFNESFFDFDPIPEYFRRCEEDEV